MLCQTCHKKEASIHYFESVDGQSRTLNLCEVCAAGVDLGDAALNMEFSAIAGSETLDKTSYQGLMTKPEGSLRCVGCGLDLETFLALRQYQCSACHDTFRQVMGGVAKAASEEAELKAQLEEAVANEDFESAAAIRDKLQELNHV